MSENHPSPDYSRPQFPAHNEPRVWMITAGDSPIGISVIRQILTHGDCALVGLAHTNPARDECRRDEFDAFLAEVESHREEGWPQRLKSVPLDIRCDYSTSTLIISAPVKSAGSMAHLCIIQSGRRMPGCSRGGGCHVRQNRYHSLLYKPRYERSIPLSVGVAVDLVYSFSWNRGGASCLPADSQSGPGSV